MLGTFDSIRRRMIAAKGHTMTLRRPLTVNPATYSDCAVTGFMRAYRPEQLTGDLRQSDVLIAISAFELDGWPVPPRVKDLMLVNDRTYALQGVQIIYEGAVVIGYDCWARGGL